MKRWAISLLLLLCACKISIAETKESEFALFKRTISPVYNIGKNGVITIPKATVIGRYNVNIGTNLQEAGQIENEKIYLTSNSIMIGTSEDVELGYTKRMFVWENRDYSSIQMDTYHFKARVLNFAEFFFPQAAIGVNAVSLSDNDFESGDQILFNPYGTVTVNIPIFTRDIILSASATLETIYNEGATGDNFLSGGVDLNFWDFFILAVESQYLSGDYDEIYNIAAKINIGWVTLAGILFNASENDLNKGSRQDKPIENSNPESYWVFHIGVHIPFGGK